MTTYLMQRWFAGRWNNVAEYLSLSRAEVWYKSDPANRRVIDTETGTIVLQPKD